MNLYGGGHALLIISQIREQVTELELLQHVALNDNKDHWRWEGDPSGSFYVKSLRYILDTLAAPVNTHQTFWNKWITTEGQLFCVASSFEKNSNKN